jgi:hypothetical protein
MARAPPTAASSISTVPQSLATDVDRLDASCALTPTTKLARAAAQPISPGQGARRAAISSEIGASRQSGRPGDSTARPNPSRSAANTTTRTRSALRWTNAGVKAPDATSAARMIAPASRGVRTAAITSQSAKAERRSGASGEPR